MLHVPAFPLLSSPFHAGWVSQELSLFLEWRDPLLSQTWKQNTSLQGTNGRQLYFIWQKLTPRKQVALTLLIKADKGQRRGWWKGSIFTLKKIYAAQAISPPQHTQYSKAKTKARYHYSLLLNLEFVFKSGTQVHADKYFHKLQSIRHENGLVWHQSL